MLKTSVSLVIAAVVLIATLWPSAIVAQNRTQTPPPLEEVKSKVARLGVGAKAKATIRLKNGTKVKGYIAQAGEDDFVMRNRKTDAPTTIRYEDVLKVEDNKGHSTARNIAIGVAVGVGAALAVLGLVIASLD